MYIPSTTAIQTYERHRKKGLGECSKETSFEILDTYYKNGGNFIDTYELQLGTVPTRLHG